MVEGKGETGGVGVVEKEGAEAAAQLLLMLQLTPRHKVGLQCCDI